MSRYIIDIDACGTCRDGALLELKDKTIRAPDVCTSGSWVTHMPPVDMP